MHKTKMHQFDSQIPPAVSQEKLPLSGSVKGTWLTATSRQVTQQSHWEGAELHLHARCKATATTSRIVSPTAHGVIPNH